MQARKKEILVGLVLAILIVIFLAPFASSHPDGLEKVAEDHAFIEKAVGKERIASPIPDYEVPGLANKTAAGILAGITGVILTFIFMRVFGRIIASSKNNDKGTRADEMGCMILSKKENTRR
jgi:cobalt/nickel transport protein